MSACSSTPPKQNQDFVKEHNRTPLIYLNYVHIKFKYINIKNNIYKYIKTRFQKSWDTVQIVNKNRMQ